MTRRQFISKSIAFSSLGGLVNALAMGRLPLVTGVRRVVGEVLLNGQPAKLDQIVMPGDTISTGAQSEVVYVMGNNAYLMREKSTMQFAQEGLVGVLRLVTGKALAVFGPGPKRIETAVATIGIRGTACYMETQEQRLYFCLCYGTADIRPLADATQVKSLTTRYHDMPLYIGSETGPAVFRPAPVINHRDVELIMLEETVGRQPPFMANKSSSDSSY
ncbi:FecR domain-containing protein [Rhodoferax sp.]|uniref:FecR domain-containing protein n=1 Tax=Rhodoferax sp. TaxID=50421 RepID=UPI0025E73C0E|nr:FecR domain-containing protein [Rhodoferax sp.]